jgi:hypothetical protein
VCTERMVAMERRSDIHLATSSADDGGQCHCLVTQTESVEDPTSFLSCVVLLRVVHYITLEGSTAVSGKNTGRRRRDFRKSF